jgi:hypothetical protein
VFHGNGGKKTLRDAVTARAASFQNSQNARRGEQNTYVPEFAGVAEWQTRLTQNPKFALVTKSLPRTVANMSDSERTKTTVIRSTVCQRLWIRSEFDLENAARPI